MTGIICVNKGKDITSFGVVAKVRGILREKRQGIRARLTRWLQGFYLLCSAAQHAF